MPPIDNQMPIHPGAPGGGGTISLATLIDYIIQRTYHELIVLSELLPRKTDMERKIEIVQFAQRTRQLFIRLLALVKWASSASKVDKCGEICNFLEQQSMWFVETADGLAKMARETLINARLPNFSLLCAIDVLTLGTYPRLPACIRDKIVPPDPITPIEKHQTLQRLDQVIQYRLVSMELPPLMRKLTIENGRVKFIVEHEFQVTLTLMGDSPTIPWRLLDIEILVEDHETGDGKSLVHSLQINYIHQLVQSRLLDNDKPLHDLCRVLHSFCQSLQLEVLHSQTQKLVRERLGDSLRVEEYTVGKSLVISYWRDQIKKEKPQDATVYKLSVHVSDEDDGNPLQISHTPTMSPEENRKVGLAIQSEHLSIENLLMQTIEVRTYAKLKELAKDLQRFVDGKCEVRDLPVALYIPVTYPCLLSEQLRITVDSRRGTLLASLPSQESHSLQDLEDTLNGDRKGLERLLVGLRLHLSLLHCEKSIQCLPAVCSRSLPIINMHSHQLDKLSRHRLYIQTPKQTNHFVVVVLNEKKPRSVEYNYYLLETHSCSAEGTEIDLTEDSIKSFMKASRLSPLDTFSFCNGPFTKLFSDPEESELESFHRKRKMLLGEPTDPPKKKIKGSPYFVPQLTHIVAACEERLPFVFLGEELVKNGFSHSGIQIDSEGICLVLSLTRLPDCEGCYADDCEAFRRNVLSCKFRILTKPTRCWQVEFMICNCPVPSLLYKECVPVQRVVLSLELVNEYQKTIRELMGEWSSMCHLYALVKEFADVYIAKTEIINMVDVKSYNYKKISLLYGPNRTSFVHLQWKADVKQFQLQFGTEGHSTTINPHIPMAVLLQQEINETRSLSELVQVLHDTWSPLTSIQKLSTAIIQGASTHPKQSTQGFCIIPQTVTHVRISFRSVNCIDVHFRSGGVVAVRDGAYSLFDSRKVTEGFTPILMFKAFLNMYVDDASTGPHPRRRSNTEDDNPPSPVGMDTMEVFSITQSHSGGSPQSRVRQDQGGPRFHGPMTPPSNPHTPASPGASRMTSAGIQQSPSPFMGTPSPGTILGVGSPGNPQLHVPSPGSFVPAPSPNSLGIHMQSPAAFISPQGIAESSSPYTGGNLAMPSPGNRNWPNSPSVPGPFPASCHSAATSPGHPTLHSPPKDTDHSKSSVVSPPSRILPSRFWAASIPTLISHDAFDKLTTPGPLQQIPFPIPASPLERFLGCVYLKRHLSRFIQNEKQFYTSIPTTEPGVILFKSEALQYKVTMNSNTLQSLHIKVSPIPESKEQWTSEEIQILEKYFDFKVACPPYKSNALTAFGRLLRAKSRIVRDCIQIMRLELMQDRNAKWSVQLCLTVPPSAAHIAPAGTPAIVVMTKVVLMLQLTRVGLQLPQGAEPQSIIIPILYDISNNSITLVERGPSNPNLSQVTQMLRRFMERYHQSPDCAIFPAVRELMTNLVLPVV
ncbi:hypothetical protein ACJMK2_030281 [Sinanodonta woodiana]|uniref:Mediator of RNA polymerase II transcription subunit 14 n=1 Tax=Sinanodonta woodiana TaxID=1069815 RepID=A0ABD3XF45_SINWO